MKVKYTVFAVLAAFLVLVVSTVSGAVDTRGIDKVRSKGVLDSKDLQIIDDFVAEAVRELVKTKDFTSVAKVRVVILARSSSGKEGAAAQYAEQFSESAYKYISEAFEQASKLTPEERKFKAILNLLILVDGLEDMRLVDLGRKMLNDENTVIRYWAVHCVTNPGITKQLNSGKEANLKLASEITEQLKGLVDSSSPEIMTLMAEFAAEIDIVQGEDLLGQIVDMRMSKYADWTVEYELLDATILKLLCGKMTSAGVSKPLPATSSDRPTIARPAPNRGWARRFGQLYSYAIQRYIKGRDFLSDAQCQRLASVLVETEKTCIGKLIGPQSIIKRAVEQDDVTALLDEHNRLLGDETGAGRLVLKLNFDYGKRPNGDRRIAPLALPEPPKELIPSVKLRTGIDD